MTPEQKAAYEQAGAEHARASRKAQGLPEQLEDPETLARIRRLVTARPANADPKGAA